MQNDAELFESLFRGGTHCHGLYDKKYPNDYITKPDMAEVSHYLAHLEGKVSIGIIPVTESGYAKFGAIDDDTHKKDKTKPVVPWTKEKYKKLLDKIKIS